MLSQDMASLKGTQTPLRRHGDEFERLPGGYYRALGRCDDTMNLGGIKVGFRFFVLQGRLVRERAIRVEECRVSGMQACWRQL
jgi:hypothetical protein